MANFNGTQVADTISGTNDDDVILGLAGNDVINGAGGNDEIDAGADTDNVLGGAGNDTVTIGANADFTATETLDGGDDDDTLAANLADADDLTQGTGSAVIGGVTQTTGTVQNFEYIQVSNASDYVLTAGEDDVFAFDLTLSDDQLLAGSSNGAIDVDGATVASNVIDADGVVFDEDEGISINGTTYGDGDTYATAGGGSVDIVWDGANDVWTFDYTAAPQSSIEVGEDAEDEVLAVQATQATTGTVIDIAVTLNMIATGPNVNLNTLGVTTATRVEGDDIANTITDGAGNDTIIGGQGGDQVILQSDADNTVWAGSTDTGTDNIDITGNGSNVVAGGGGADDIDITGTGDNEAWGGAAADNIAIGTSGGTDGGGNNIIGGGEGGDALIIDGDGDNQAWGGAGDDNIDVGTANGDAAGDNMVGGSDGTDDIDVNGDGNNTIYGGNDDDADTIDIAATATGDNTIYGGGTTAGGGAGTDNQITIAGTGANTVFNGGGDDAVAIAATATGDNMLYGGAGDDTFTFASADATATIIFEAGNGADEITGFVAGDDDHIVDLSALGFTDADDVLDSMTDDGADVTLFVTAGQTITFAGVDLTDLQSADPADWLIL